LEKILKNRSGIEKILHWTGKGSLAVVDQALFAGSNFVLSILLARWLTPAEYGAFAVAFSIFLLLSTFYTALIIEPMLVFGAGKYDGGFFKYIRFLISGHWRFTVAVSCFLLIVGGVFWRLDNMDLAQALLGLVVSAPFILKVWLLRRAFYVHSEPFFSAVGGFLYLVLMTAGLYALYQVGALSPLTGFGVVGLVSALTGLFLQRMLDARIRLKDGPIESSMVVAEHWQYGKWMVATYGVVWLRDNIYYLILPLWLSLEASAALRAVMNFILPMVSFNTAISIFILPMFAKAYHSQGIKQLQKMVLFSLAVYILSTAAYWAVLYFARAKLFLLCYGGLYSEYAYLLGIAGALPVISGVLQVLNNTFRVAERTDQIFFVYMITGVLALGLGVWSASLWGVLGAIVGMLAAYIAIVAGLVLYSFLKRDI
jgi:O-antigen/teichoic acid export membrane protein